MIMLDEPFARQYRSLLGAEEHLRESCTWIKKNPNLKNGNQQPGCESVR